MELCALETKEGWEKGGDSGAAIVPGKPEESLLIKAVSYHDKDLAMPPAKKGGKLPEAAIAALTQWVRMGAPDPRVDAVKLGGMKADEAKTWWAFQPLPKADAASSPAGIDRFIQRELEACSIKPSAPADTRGNLESVGRARRRRNYAALHAHCQPRIAARDATIGRIPNRGR